VVAKDKAAEESERERLRRLTVAARMMAAQLVALVYLSANNTSGDVKELMEFVMKEMAAAADPSDKPAPTRGPRPLRRRV